MKQKPLIICGTVLLIGLSVTVGDDPAKALNKKDPNATENAVTKARAVPEAKLNQNADSKPNTKHFGQDSEEQPMSADEKAIRMTCETYESAFSKGDAKAIAAQFTEDAELIDECGVIHRGRQAIETVMKVLFEETTDASISVNIDSIRIVSPGVAIEDGTTVLTSSENDEPIKSSYTAVHVKNNGKWLTASVREKAPKDRRLHRVQLQQLAWLQGDWVDEGQSSVVLFSCKPIDGGAFLLRQFIVQVAGQQAMSGTERIGWDPVNGKLRAWVFDSEGGYSDGYWHRSGDRWFLKESGVTADGQTASFTSIYTLINGDTMTWQSVDREVDGVALPDGDTVTIVRRPPTPDILEDIPASKSD